MSLTALLAGWDAFWADSQHSILPTILLMAGVTVLARSFFFIPDAEWTLPRWAQRGHALGFAVLARHQHLAITAAPRRQQLRQLRHTCRNWHSRDLGWPAQQ